MYARENDDNYGRPLTITRIADLITIKAKRLQNSIYIDIIQIMCVCVCLSSIGGQTAGPIMTKFGKYMWIDLGMVPI